MLLVIDVGNSNTVIGLYQEKELVHHFRISTTRGRTSDELGDLMLALLERQGVAATDIKGSILASVVPPLNRALRLALERYFNTSPLVVGPGLKTGMPILTDQPAEVGADRIVNAVAAFARYKHGMIVVDFGTATTFDVVNPQGEYLGGAIAPGIDISMDALFSHAAKLPRIELKRPQTIIGKNTVSALQAGLFYGYVGLVDELVTRMQAEAGFETFVLATGGLAVHFAEVSRTIQAVDEHLTLEGLRVLYANNQKTKGASR
ncbi:MAG: type III pantothenate kinase [Deltaproteobacteria bacterium]|nr:type III pantothenate kinase [Deltaproteobacteria bacterium]